MRAGERIAELRRGAGITQEQLAVRLYVSRELVAKWETGDRRPGRGAISEMALLFGVSEDDISPRDQAVMEELAACVPEDRAISDEDILPLLNAFLRTLPQRERGVFIRRYHHLQPTVQISAESGLSESNVRTMLTRTRKRLKKYYEEAAK
ncbi:MAG: helix-turn-helix domain-containing protein [Clostridia bacterium]|nr:helix-turn-helix domain-containing protein [Clostridia bacterium]MBP5657732.1 helix-turn-helix domain-containing protein [Clostridia bacterium]MBP5755711.1 helix-turn-helix domain-containing protein [Clostridia bacterium]